MSVSKKIYITSLETCSGAWRNQEEQLRGLWEMSSKRHTLVEKPEAADIIFVGDLRDEDWFARTLASQLIARYPEKCFTSSEADIFPLLPLLPGVYCSTSRSWWFQRRYRSGSYRLHHPDFRNPFIHEKAKPGFELEKQYKASFVGRKSHKARETIFKLLEDLDGFCIKDTSKFNFFEHDSTGKKPQQRIYADVLSKSCFAICPRGIGTSSVRLFEAMALGVPPIIISDDWVPPTGPDWSSFSIFVAEKDIQAIPGIINERLPECTEMGKRARKAHFEFFSESAYFDYLICQFSEILENRIIPESWFWRLKKANIFATKAKRRLYALCEKNSLKISK